MGEARAAHQPAVTAARRPPRGVRRGGAGGSDSLQVAPELP